MRIVLTWALSFAAIGFGGGFFGPMILTPDANQGPMLGIFITGPLGFLSGAAIGTAIVIFRAFR
jgi:hypothetical protein